MEGKELLFINQFDKEFTTMHPAFVDENKIMFKSFKNMGFYNKDEEFIKNDKEIYQEYELAYLGNHKFSELKMTISKKYSELNCSNKEGMIDFNNTIYKRLCN